MLMTSFSNIVTYSASATFTPLSSVECNPGTISTYFTGELNSCASFIISVADIVLLLGMTKVLLDFFSVEMKYLASLSVPNPDVTTVS